ncbi:hypothetical protein [Nonomuraea sp. NPDC003709]|uniref:hypothetical protein n=1 Tax=Nonomuraea sp. NPDC003709 TaxID=3154450 RepID=UPI0033B1CAE5
MNYDKGIELTFPEHQFGKVFQRYAGSVARQGCNLSLDARLLLAAIARANNTGHAVFKSGELRQVLSREKPDGTVKPASRSTVYDTLKKLRLAGLALPRGGETCVWLPREFWERGLDKGAMCPVHQTWESGYVSNVDSTMAHESYDAGPMW